jgi:hypothetical protein
VIASLAGCAASWGCLGVPEVTFVADDAAAQQDVTMTGTDAAADGADAGAAPESGAGDAPAAGCPDATPPGATQCCGTAACKGAPPACSSECTNCSNNCPGRACCLDKHGNYTGCAATPQACP